MKLFQLNAEHSKHDTKVIPFIEHSQPDIITFQEVSRGTLSKLTKVFTVYFEPSFTCDGTTYGIALLVKKCLEITNARFLPYTDGIGDTAILDHSHEHCDYYTHGRFGILAGKVTGSEGTMDIGTTYFPVSYPGYTTNEPQRAAMSRLIPIISRFTTMILTGDCNIARSSSQAPGVAHPLYHDITRVMTDHIPVSVSTTLDPALHRVGGNLQIVCDYIFSRGDVRVEDVRLHRGLSDHQGITAHIAPQK